eukprot:569249_1
MVYRIFSSSDTIIIQSILSLFITLSANKHNQFIPSIHLLYRSTLIQTHVPINGALKHMESYNPRANFLIIISFKSFKILYSNHANILIVLLSNTYSNNSTYT